MKLAGIDTDKIRMGMDNKRMSAMLCAILDAVGPVTLTKEQAERTWGMGVLGTEQHADGSFTIWLKEESA